MNEEWTEIGDFLNLYPPFNLLSAAQRNALSNRLEIQYARRGTQIFTPGGINDALHLIRSGAVDVHGPEGKLLRRLGEGEVFGAQALIRGGRVQNRVTAIEDVLIYRLPQQEFHRLCHEEYAFAEFFVPIGADRLSSALRHLPQEPFSHLQLNVARVRDLAPPQAVTAAPSISIRQAAEIMMLQQVSALLLVDGENILGITTDRDIAIRAMATGLSGDLPITTIMTPHLSMIGMEEYVIDAMLMMARQNINHLPVHHEGNLAGMLTSEGIAFKQLGSLPSYLVRRIVRASDMLELRETAMESQRLLATMVATNATAQSTGRTMTHITDAITQRLIRMAEERLGPPPVGYAWMAGGSQGRQEQGVRGDQDNCLILDDAYDPARHKEYFDRLSRMVCDGLDACGYAYCPGEMMACTPSWQLPLRLWRRHFSQWIETPSHQALMLSCVFFDLRLVSGVASLFDDLHRLVLEKARNNSAFLAHMAFNALSRQPPLGFFRNLVLENSGEHAETLDLKLNGVIPIVDLARVYALEHGVEAVNTWERLSLACEKGGISSSAAQDLSEALEFIGATRFRHQARNIREGVAPNNHLSPKELSDFERHHLKDAFGVVQWMQRSLAQRHQISYIT